MEFNGAVLVDKKKIRSAIDNYTTLKLDYLDVKKRCQDKLASEINTLSRWELFKCNSDFYDWTKVYYTKYGHLFVLASTEFRGSWLYRFYRINLLSSVTLHKYRLVEEYHEHFTKCNIVKTLGTFVLVGEDIYLNEEQARFVGHFCDQGLL